MNENAAPKAPASPAAPPSQPVSRPLDKRAVTAALAAIQTDSRRQPETYLRDTVVPHGGE